ncbi:hypothetical protein ANCCAN_16020 [Ancylostoma caninum]|uniref:Uncharacterized protein n=1 Tax=Ancylostoma caninum TaxID=29170 RepID=A0A368G512_ANCCA|nr:hypothetical protein ANCCAN_16020 [Ancylostoma caninum]
MNFAKVSAKEKETLTEKALNLRETPEYGLVYDCSLEEEASHEVALPGSAALFNCGMITFSGLLFSTDTTTAVFLPR